MKPMFSMVSAVAAAVSLFGAVGTAQADGNGYGYGSYHPAAPVYSQAAYSQPVYTAPAPVAPWNNPSVVAEVRSERQGFRAWVQRERSEFDRREDREAYEFRAYHHSWNQMRRFNEHQLRERQDFNARMAEAQRQSEGRLAARFGEWVYTHSC